MTCDFFGAHTSFADFSREVPDYDWLAKKYFGEIMMPFRYNAQKGIEKIKDLPIKTIAPSHGPIHRNPERILGAYRKWANGETKRKAIIVYSTMWKSTEKMIHIIADALQSEGIEIAQYNLTVADIGDIAKDLVDSRAVILGTPTVLGGAHPVAMYAAYLVKALKPPTKYAVVLSSYGWGGGAVKHIQETLGPTKMEIVGAMEILGPPTENDVAKISEMGRTLGKKIKEEK
jgi:flavorubredoxin